MRRPVILQPKHDKKKMQQKPSTFARKELLQAHLVAIIPLAAGLPQG
jgi:hypothetical protein